MQAGVDAGVVLEGETIVRRTEAGQQALVPLAEGALRNVTAKGTTAGLTGPVRRGDAPTIQRHLDSLQDRPGVAQLYRALARHAVEIAARIDGPDAPDREGLARIRQILET